MSHDHAHDAPESGLRLAIVIGLNFVVTIAEISGTCILGQGSSPSCVQNPQAGRNPSEQDDPMPSAINPPFPVAHAFHISLRVADLDHSTALYGAFLGAEPKERTARYSTFIVPHQRLNPLLLGVRAEQRPEVRRRCPHVRHIPGSAGQFWYKGTHSITPRL